eukprot:CAMPEP_0182893718 /NCGR_PEP_ID=MMETSP0034_2-20130328/24648_1 /TAXON_ID=156128 /ORGANISM="Nephroselmis pyriformis, Strain CCMP717" /LENGTH=319 /DNA_ID=CAMNT_0025027479 /DNA_START=17 /DNA_END=971 /DNA_ORIENTATION=-
MEFVKAGEVAGPSGALTGSCGCLGGVLSSRENTKARERDSYLKKKKKATEALMGLRRMSKNNNGLKCELQANSRGERVYQLAHEGNGIITNGRPSHVPTQDTLLCQLADEMQSLDINYTDVFLTTGGKLGDGILVRTEFQALMVSLEVNLEKKEMEYLCQYLGMVADQGFCRCTELVHKINQAMKRREYVKAAARRAFDDARKHARNVLAAKQSAGSPGGGASQGGNGNGVVKVFPLPLPGAEGAGGVSVQNVESTGGEGTPTHKHRGGKVHPFPSESRASDERGKRWSHDLETLILQPGPASTQPPNGDGGSGSAGRG